MSLSGEERKNMDEWRIREDAIQRARATKPADTPTPVPDIPAKVKSVEDKLWPAERPEPVRVIVEFKGPSQRQQIWQAVIFLVFLVMG